MPLCDILGWPALHPYDALKVPEAGKELGFEFTWFTLKTSQAWLCICSSLNMRLHSWRSRTQFSLVWICFFHEAWISEPAPQSFSASLSFLFKALIGPWSSQRKAGDDFSWRWLIITAPGRWQPFPVAFLLPLIANQVPAQWQYLTIQILCECLLCGKVSFVLVVCTNNLEIRASVVKHRLLLRVMLCAKFLHGIPIKPCEVGISIVPMFNMNNPRLTEVAKNCKVM